MKTFKKKNIKNNRAIWARLFFVLCLLLLILGIVLFKNSELWNKINSIDKVRNFVESKGAFGVVAYMLLQFLQTTVLQIPSLLVTIAGSLIFGRWKAFLFTYISVLCGSLVMYWVGKLAGRKFLTFLFGENKVDKWTKMMSNGKYLFFLMMLFPLFPDDILCAVAGLSKMDFKFFLFTNIISRAIGIFSTVFLFGGAVIPFTGFGLIIWLLIACAVICLFYVSVKYKEKIDDWINKKE